MYISSTRGAVLDMGGLDLFEEMLWLGFIMHTSNMLALLQDKRPKPIII